MSYAAASRHPIDSTAVATMVLLCFLWGFTHVASKLAAADVSLVMQSGLRSIVATLLLYGWCRTRGVQLFAADATLVPGLLAGALFATEFVFIALSLTYTNASRTAVFIYTAPFLTALGAHWLVPSERLRTTQWLGVLIAFGGIVVAFGEGFARPGMGSSWIGDLFGVIAGALWAATILLIRVTKLAVVSAAKTLFYQLAVSALLLPLVSVLLGEPGIVAITPVAFWSLAYQGVIVAFGSYLAWFWLLTRYMSARLSVFTFLTPMFGVLAGAMVLSEALSSTFVAAVLLVGLGIYLVNQPGR